MDMVRVRSLAFFVILTSSSNETPAAAAAPAALNTMKVPTLPRRFSFSSGFAAATSSVM